MGMSTHVVGFVPPNDRWAQMKQVWDSCKAAKVEVPEAVQRFFNWEEPDDRGVEVQLPAIEWTEDTRHGYEVELDKIPPDVKVIRFYNAW